MQGRSLGTRLTRPWNEAKIILLVINYQLINPSLDYHSVQCKCQSEIKISPVNNINVDLDWGVSIPTIYSSFGGYGADLEVRRRREENKRREGRRGGREWEERGWRGGGAGVERER